MSHPITLSDIKMPGRAGDPDFHLSTYQCGDENATPIVFVHGFPDVALGWQHQLQAVANAGFRAIAPNMRGYATSSCPQEVSAYTMAELTGDLVALLDALDIEKAIFAGHDWGGWITWGMPVLHPKRTMGIANSCTPYIPFPDVQTHADVVEGEAERQYVVWFQEPDTAENLMDQHVEPIVRKIMRRAAPLGDVVKAAIVDGKINMNPFINAHEVDGVGDPLLDAESFAHYVKCFETSGFRGGINYYRNIDNNIVTHPDIGVVPLDLPCLMITAELDPGLRPEFAADMPERCSDLEMHMIEGAAHWVQQENADEFNALLVEWLRRKFS